jgi:hypothetical protein
LASVVRYVVLALGASDRNAGEPSRLVWTICMGSERARPLLALKMTTVLSVRRETLKLRTRMWNARMPL